MSTAGDDKILLKAPITKAILGDSRLTVTISIKKWHITVRGGQVGFHGPFALWPVVQLNNWPSLITTMFWNVWNVMVTGLSGNSIVAF